jgi:putative transposase
MLYICIMQPTSHNRQSYRLRYHSYAEASAYHITICSHQRQLIFGKIIDAQMHLSPIGKIIDEEIRKTIAMRKDVIVDTYTVMPNHVHIIFILTETKDAPVARKFEAPASDTISSIVNGMKACCTSRVRKELGPSDAAIWQSRFHDRLIRDEAELNLTRAYIINNPGAWEDDPENPERMLKMRRMP